MLEVESKFRSPGNDVVLKSLGDLGARLISDETFEDAYYSHPTRAFDKTDEALRLRMYEDHSELTYKGPRTMSSSAKAREELSAHIEDSLSLRRILERLGFAEIASVRKRRVSFAFDLLRVDVDDVEGLGQFVELELMTEDPSRAERLIAEAKERLGLCDMVDETYLEMILNGR